MQKKPQIFLQKNHQKLQNGRAPEASMKQRLNQVLDPNVPRNVKAFGHITPSSDQPPTWGANRADG